MNLPIGEQLLQERLRQGKTQKEVAEKAEIDEPRLSRIETGKNRNPTVATLLNLANALGKTIVVSLEEKSN